MAPLEAQSGAAAPVPLGPLVVVAITQTLDLTPEGVQSASEVPGGLVHEAGTRLACLGAGTVQGTVTLVPGRDAALRRQQISATGVIVAPYHGLLKGEGIRGR